MEIQNTKNTRESIKKRKNEESHSIRFHYVVFTELGLRIHVLPDKRGEFRRSCGTIANETSTSLPSLPFIPRSGRQDRREISAVVFQILRVRGTSLGSLAFYNGVNPRVMIDRRNEKCLYPDKECWTVHFLSQNDPSWSRLKNRPARWY